MKMILTCFIAEEKFESKSIFVAQCIEKDLCAQGSTKEEFIDQVVDEAFPMKLWPQSQSWSDSQIIELTEGLKKILKKLL